jgi:hypothetical protein
MAAGCSHSGSASWADYFSLTHTHSLGDDEVNGEQWQLVTVIRVQVQNEDNLWVFGTAIQNHSFQQLTALERHCTCRSNLLSMFTEEQRFLERFTFNEEQMGF